MLFDELKEIIKKQKEETLKLKNINRRHPEMKHNTRKWDLGTNIPASWGTGNSLEEEIARLQYWVEELSKSEEEIQEIFTWLLENGVEIGFEIITNWLQEQLDNGTFDDLISEILNDKFDEFTKEILDIISEFDDRIKNFKGRIDSLAIDIKYLDGYNPDETMSSNIIKNGLELAKEEKAEFLIIRKGDYNLEDTLFVDFSDITIKFDKDAKIIDETGKSTFALIKPTDYAGNTYEERVQKEGYNGIRNVTFDGLNVDKKGGLGHAIVMLHNYGVQVVNSEFKNFNVQEPIRIIASKNVVISFNEFQDAFPTQNSEYITACIKIETDGKGRAEEYERYTSIDYTQSVDIHIENNNSVGFPCFVVSNYSVADKMYRNIRIYKNKFVYNGTAIPGNYATIYLKNIVKFDVSENDIENKEIPCIHITTLEGTYTQQGNSSAGARIEPSLMYSGLIRNNIMRSNFSTKREFACIIRSLPFETKANAGASDKIFNRSTRFYIESNEIIPKINDNKSTHGDRGMDLYGLSKGFIMNNLVNSMLIRYPYQMSIQNNQADWFVITNDNNVNVTVRYNTFIGNMVAGRADNAGFIPNDRESVRIIGTLGHPVDSLTINNNSIAPNGREFGFYLDYVNQGALVGNSIRQSSSQYSAYTTITCVKINEVANVSYGKYRWGHLGNSKVEEVASDYEGETVEYNGIKFKKYITEIAGLHIPGLSSNNSIKGVEDKLIEDDSFFKTPSVDYGEGGKFFELD